MPYSQLAARSLTLDVAAGLDTGQGIADRMAPQL
jgi:hypothetical protein